MKCRQYITLFPHGDIRVGCYLSSERVNHHWSNTPCTKKCHGSFVSMMLCDDTIDMFTQWLSLLRANDLVWLPMHYICKPLSVRFGWNLDTHHVDISLSRAGSFEISRDHFYLHNPKVHVTDEWDKVELHMYVKKYLRLLTYAIIPLLLFMERGWSQSHLTSILTFIVVKTYASL